MSVQTDPYNPCEQCGVNDAVLDTYCPSCGIKALCVDCIVAHIAQIAEQAGPSGRNY
jgi:hypothetical protein